MHMMTYSNPLSNDGLRPDPFVLRFNGRYYLYCTHPEIICWSSENLVDWKFEGPVVCRSETEPLVPFAPEVIYLNGLFYLYTSPSGKGHFVFQSDSPLGPFKKISTNLQRSLDASPFLDDDNSLYLYWADDRGILGCNMLSPTEPGDTVLVCATTMGWTEGPQVIKEDGVYYLTYCGNHFLSKGYRVNCAVSAHPLGPFVDLKANPILVKTEGKHVALGHCSTVWGPNLLLRYVVYHNLNKDHSRDFNIDPILFHDEKVILLGPSFYEREAPPLPHYSASSSDLQDASLWNMKAGRFGQSNPLGINVLDSPNVMSIRTFELSCSVVEMHVAANSHPYGLVFGDFRIEIPSENTYKLFHHEKAITDGNLPFALVADVLHSYVFRSDTLHLKIYIDGLLLSQLDNTDSNRGCIGYYALKGDLVVGHTQVSLGTTITAFDSLSYTLPAHVEGKKDFYLAVPATGRYILHSSVKTKTHAMKVVLDNELRQLEPLASGYDLFLKKGVRKITVDDGSDYSAETIVVHKRIQAGYYQKNISPKGSYGKYLLGNENMSSFELKAEFKRNQMGKDGAFGVIFRTTNSAEGGEGKDRVLGINFFIGYGFHITATKFVLSKHRYDSNVLVQIPSDLYLSQDISVRITGIGPYFEVFVNDSSDPIISYHDEDPLLFGRCGIRFSSCLIDRAAIDITCLD